VATSGRARVWGEWGGDIMVKRERWCRGISSLQRSTCARTTHVLTPLFASAVSRLIEFFLKFFGSTEMLWSYGEAVAFEISKVL
jgi:hypothetical protein